jgi:hypothetical protein
MQRGVTWRSWPTMARMLPAERAEVASKLAQIAVRALSAARATTVVEYRLWIEAARRPELRPLAQGWSEAYQHFFANVLIARGTRLQTMTPDCWRPPSTACSWINWPEPALTTIPSSRHCSSACSALS